MRKMRLQTLPLILTALLFALSSVSAFAFPIPYGEGTTAGAKFEDDDVDFFENKDADPLISVGDVLYAPFEIDKIADIYGGNGDDGTYILDQDMDELVGLSTLEVLSVDSVTGDMVFGQHGSTPILEFFQGGDNLDLISLTSPPGCTSQADCLSKATDGTALFAFSLDADADTEWVFNSNVGASIADTTWVAGQPGGNILGTANFALNQVNLGNGYDNFFRAQDLNCTLFGCTGDGLADLTGSANIMGGSGLENGAFARSDTDMTVNVIPEPGTFVLLGAGLLGVAALRKKKS